MGVLRRSTWILVIAACAACLQANDRVLQPEGADKTPRMQTSMQSSASGSKSAESPAEAQAAGGSKGAAGKPADAGAAAVGGSGGSGSTGVTGMGKSLSDAGTTSPTENEGAAGKAGDTSREDASTGSMSSDAGTSDGGMSSSSAQGAADPECDFHGIWIAKQMTVSEALSLPQTSNNWYYLELKQVGNSVEIAKHFDCGIEVRGSATVVLSRATLEASIGHNLQAGRKINVERKGATCSFEAARYWSIRGADELRFLPGEPNPGRDFPDSIADVAKAKPLPTPQKPDGAIDVDNDGKPGIAFQVTGIIMGTRNSVQRDWTRWFTEPGYEIMASSQWTSDLTVRADFDNEESIIDPTSGLLVSNSAPRAGSKHVLKLRFLGRDASDPRVAEVVKDNDVDTCYAIQDAMPAGTLE